MLETIPPWNGAHPAIVHVPVAIGLVAPLLVLGAVLRPKATGWAWASFCLLVLAAVSGWIAYYSGEAAEHHFQSVGFPTIQAKDATTQHHDLGGLARYALTASCIAFAVWLRVATRITPAKARWIGIAALAISLAAAGLVIVTAHQGGQLVHRHGMLAPQSAVE